MGLGIPDQDAPPGRPGSDEPGQGEEGEAQTGDPSSGGKLGDVQSGQSADQAGTDIDLPQKSMTGRFVLAQPVAELGHAGKEGDPAQGDMRKERGAPERIPQEVSGLAAQQALVFRNKGHQDGIQADGNRQDVEQDPQ